MLAEVVDAVIGIDTHRDSHEVEIADRTGSPILTTRIANDSAGFAHLLGLIAQAAPGPRVAVAFGGEPELRRGSGADAGGGWSATDRV